jgi:nicotinamide-nucleotide amidase
MNPYCIELATRLGEALRQRKLHISCAESCTGGGLAYALTSVAGSSAWFSQSYVTYSNHAKQALLGVKSEQLDQYGAVSSQVVEQMAKGCAKVSNADLAIAISGIAGPDGGSEQKPLGTVWFGFHYSANKTSSTQSIRQHFNGDRLAIRSVAITFALEQSLTLIANKK